MRGHRNAGVGGQQTPVSPSMVTAAGTIGDCVWSLTDPRAQDVSRSGGKAAALAHVHAAGLPALPGLVVPTGTSVDPLTADSPLIGAIRSELGRGTLVARSSSPLEDTEDSSMAGQFESILGIEDDAALAEAIRSVATSGRRVAEQAGMDSAPPVAVLVQPHVDARVGGVCFGVEPVTGRSDRRLIVASAAGPDAVVSGEVTGVRHLVDRDGELVRADGDEDGGRLDDEECRELSRLAQRCEEVFGAPQDMEFLIDGDGVLWLLQSRPVTTEVRGAPQGPVYGTGPVSETFPDVLRPLEADLWVPPLREGMREALRLAAMASPAELERRPIVLVVEGRVAVDLELTGGHRPPRSWHSRLNLAPWFRRSKATWRVGRLRAALPGLGRDVVAQADDALAQVGSLAELTDPQLVGLLERSQVALRSLHGHEILMGFLVSPGVSRLTGASVAVRALIAGRRQGLGDSEIIARSPVVLALTGPRIGGVHLPDTSDQLPPALPPDATAHEPALVREALRLRVRWTQELMARAASELARRLVERGTIPAIEAVLALDRAELAALVDRSAVAARAETAGRSVDEGGSRLPVRFQLDAEGRAVPCADGGSEDGTGAGGGAGSGTVTLDPASVEDGVVLVVQELQPELAGLLPRLAGLVAESGSPLAHLAILARESSVPTVVGLQGATSRFTEGQTVDVDGDAGTVEVREEVTA